MEAGGIQSTGTSGSWSGATYVIGMVTLPVDVEHEAHRREAETPEAQALSMILPHF